MPETEKGVVTGAEPSASPMVTYTRGRTVLLSALCALGAGVVASLMAVVLMGVLRIAAGIPTPMELFGDRVLKSIDVHTFIHLLSTFAPNSKTAPLGLALLGMIGAGVVLSLLYAPLVRLKLPVTGYRLSRREWIVALAFAVGMTLVGVVLFWDELRQNQFGLPINWATTVSALGLLADFGLYALLLGFAYRVLLPKQRVSGSTKTVAERRLLLSRAGVAALGVGAGAASLGLVREYLAKYTSYDGTGTETHNGVTSPITPNAEHYVVTQNAVDPTVNTALWRLEVTGLVGKPGTYTYEEVQNLPSISRAVTLECIANGVGSGLMSTAIWQGVTLQSLLERHGGALANATHAAFHSTDGYTISLPLKEVLEADPILAWRMNGEVLSQRHGFPLRVLMPGRYGEENPKWLTRVELTDHFVGGLYADQGWYNGPLHTTSRIDRPTDRVSLGQSIEIAGIAFAGNRGIQRVEVSTDGGTTWQDATLKPALSKDSWVFWSWQWRPSAKGSYTLVCRATDGTGEVQTSRKQGTVPNGATGYHEVTVQVA